MRVLVMCEGPNELEIIQMLLEGGFLIFSEDDLLGLRPYYAKQINTAIKTELNIYPGNDVCVYRVGDTLTDALKIPVDFKEKIKKVEKYCTKPELEMLLIIAEGKWDDYNKVKSSVKPKDFAKMNVIYNGKRYDNSTAFYREYFGERKSFLKEAVQEYRRLKKHRKGEGFLADLIS
jgi:hypothetical protein